jgi:glycyl-tRNA synthetase beta chain
LKLEAEEDASTLTSFCLVLADRIETLVGIWGIGLKPTGDKDPFALRRNALSVISSFEKLGLMRAILSLDAADAPVQPAPLPTLQELLRTAVSVFKKIELSPDTVGDVATFIYERDWNLLAPIFGLEVVESVVSLRPRLEEIVGRVRAVQAFKKLPEAPALAAANKRISNILKKSEGTDANATVDPALLQEPAEKELHAALQGIAATADAQFAAGDYTASLQTLAALRAPVDAFFERVMVNAEEPALRNNRLGLLKQLHNAMNRVADLSRLAA